MKPARQKKHFLKIDLIKCYHYESRYKDKIIESLREKIRNDTIIAVLETILGQDEEEK